MPATSRHGHGESRRCAAQIIIRGDFKYPLDEMRQYFD
jgi:hypothetical protein